MLLLVVAYAIVWLLLFGYLGSVARRQRRVADELEELAGQVRELQEADDRGH